MLSEKEQNVQKALGTLKKYDTPIVVSVPYVTSIYVLVNVNVDAVNPDEAKQIAVGKLKAMSEKDIRKLVADGANDSNFVDMNQTEMSDLFEAITDAHPEKYVYDPDAFEPEEAIEQKES